MWLDHGDRKSFKVVEGGSWPIFVCWTGWDEMRWSYECLAMVAGTNKGLSQEESEGNLKIVTVGVVNKEDDFVVIEIEVVYKWLQWSIHLLELGSRLGWKSLDKRFNGGLTLQRR